MRRYILTQELKRDEGFISHVYQDHLGYHTIGIGRLVDKRRGGGITEEEATYLLENDIDKVVNQLDYKLPWWRGLSDARQRALANMCFQMGINGLLKFKRMLRALEHGDYELARKEALDSVWAQQTPNRAARVVNLISEG